MVDLEKMGTNNSFCFICHHLVCLAQRQTKGQAVSLQKTYTIQSPLPHPTIPFSPCYYKGGVGRGQMGGGGKGLAPTPAQVPWQCNIWLLFVCHFQQWVMAAWICFAVMWDARAKAQDTKERKACFSSIGRLLLLPLSFPPPFALFSVWEALPGLYCRLKISENEQC